MLLLDPWSGMTQSPFLLFFGAVVFSAWAGGFKAGVLATILSVLLSNYFFVYPFYSISSLLTDSPSLIRAMVFTLEGVFVSYLSEALIVAKRRSGNSLQHLKASEERFCLALSSSKITVFQQDETYHYQWAYHPHGQQASSQILGKTDYDIFPSEEAEKLLAIKQRVLSSGLPFRDEIALTVNGNLRYYDLILQCIEELPEQTHRHQTLSGSREKRILGVAIDVTERWQIERALRESEERFRAMFNQAAVGIAQVALDGNFIEINPALCEITGYSYEELSQMTFQEITHPDDLKADWAMAERVLKREIAGYSLEKRYLRKDGSVTWVNLTSSAVWDETTQQPKYAVGIIEDISDRKQVEAMQQILVEASTLLASSLDYEVTLAKLARLTVPVLADWCVVDVVQENWTLHQLAIASDNPTHQALLREMRRRYPPSSAKSPPLMQELQQGRSIFYSQLPASLLVNMAEDAEHLQMLQQLNTQSLMVIPLLGRGQVFGVLSLARTEPNKPYQLSDLALAEDIARRAATAIDNARLYQEAEQANRIKDEFLAILSHELRTPLNPILGWAKLLRTRSYDAETTARALEIIERNAKLQVQLVEDLLDVSRILRGKLNLNASTVDLVNVIHAAMETVRLSAEAKSIDFQFSILHPDHSRQNLLDSRENTSIPIHDKTASLVASCSVSSSSPYQVYGDSGRLQQVVWNLLSNAVKFTSNQGQVRVELSIVEAIDRFLPTDASGSPTLPMAQIKVIDTGKGISPDFLPYVFDYFRQADGTTTRKFGGLGLGLAIVRHLVELHGGSVAAESQGENQGSVFTVRLPLIPQSQQGQGEDGRSLSPRINSQSLLKATHLLIVEDEADTRELLAFLLRQQGAEVTAVASASQALEVFPHIRPHLLVCDIGMPEMDGYMLMRQIRAMPAEQGGNTPAIALTAYVAEYDQRQAKAVGFQRHLAKPVEPDQLVTTIVELIQP